MTEFNDWCDDERFTQDEAKVLLVRTASTDFDKILLRRALWLNPPGRRSTRVNFDVQLLSEDKLRMETRSVVAGWKCVQCQATLFGTRLEDLKHRPCCDATQ